MRMCIRLTRGKRDKIRDKIKKMHKRVPDILFFDTLFSRNRVGLGGRLGLF